MPRPVALTALLIAALGGASRLTAGDDWPQHRGPRGDGTADAAVPTTWGETENVRWKVPVHGKGWSSPVVAGDRVWVTTADEVSRGKEVERVSFFALAFDRTTGRLIHDIKLFAEDKPAFSHPFNSYASPTPALDGGKVYAHFGSHGTVCLDAAAGAVVWARHDLPCNHWRGPASSPTVWGNRVYLIYDGYDQQYVVALDKLTGRTAWKKDRGIKYASDNPDVYKAYATPAVMTVDGRPELVCPSAEETIAYDPATGAERWRVRHGGMNGAAKPVAGHGLLYLTSGYPAKLLAVRAGGPAVAWTTAKGVPTRPSLLLLGDLLYLVDDKGSASCLDARTGKVRWREQFASEFSASPVAAGGRVYFCGQDGRTYVVAAKPDYDLVATNRLADGFMASPAAAGGCLFLRTRTHLYCVGK